MFCSEHLFRMLTLTGLVLYSLTQITQESTFSFVEKDHGHTYMFEKDPPAELFTHRCSTQLIFLIAFFISLQYLFTNYCNNREL